MPKTNDETPKEAKPSPARPEKPQSPREYFAARNKAFKQKHGFPLPSKLEQLFLRRCTMAGPKADIASIYDSLWSKS